MDKVIQAFQVTTVIDGLLQRHAGGTCVAFGYLGEQRESLNSALSILSGSQSLPTPFLLALLSLENLPDKRIAATAA